MTPRTLKEQILEKRKYYEKQEAEFRNKCKNILTDHIRQIILDKPMYSFWAIGDRQQILEYINRELLTKEKNSKPCTKELLHMFIWDIAKEQEIEIKHCGEADDAPNKDISWVVKLA